MLINLLSRGLAVLSFIAENSSQLTLTEISKKLHLSMSTVQRMTYTLQHLKYLDRDEETKKILIRAKGPFSWMFDHKRSGF